MNEKREVERIRDQHRRAFERDAWHGPAVLELLDGLGHEAALARPIPGAHGILELVLHIAAWEATVARRLRTKEAIELTPDEDWEKPTFTAEGWEAAKKRLEESRRALDDALAELTDERLSEPVPGKDYAVYVMLHGVVQHTLYHAGQIAMSIRALERYT